MPIFFLILNSGDFIGRPKLRKLHVHDAAIFSYKIGLLH
jgi:hypothetical protein